MIQLVHLARSASGRLWLLAAMAGAAAGPALAQNKAQPVNPPLAPPGAGFDPPHVVLPPIATDDPETITLAAFAEPVQLLSLVELVAQTLHINITIQGDLSGTVVFNAPVPVRKSELIPLLDSLLEQQGWTVTQNHFGFYTVQQVGTVGVNLAGQRATTRVFSTPNIRPSALQATISGQFVPQALPSQTGGVQRQISYIDELGIIVATDTPRRLDALATLIDAILAEYARSEFTRIELASVAAPVARERALQLVGQLTQSRAASTQGQETPQPLARAGALDNIGDRLTIDPQGNALIFRGLPEEIDVVREIVAVIDVPNSLLPRSYFAGIAASGIADIARSRGLGEVTTIANTAATGRQPGAMGAFDAAAFQRARQGAPAIGGPVMVVDESRGTIIYYGTREQHAQLDALVKELDTQSERVVIQAYKLAHGDAEKVAEIINGILTNTGVASEAPLLGGSDSPRLRAGGRPDLVQPRNPSSPPAPAGGAAPGGGDLELDSADAFVIADKSNNQVIVKARAGQQKEFARLIEKLDLRRPQVFIEARIVAVTWTDTMRLAFETQLNNADGTGGAVNTNFGLGSFAAGAAITATKLVTPGAGLTAALIRNDYVPIIINAMQTEGDGRILSSPQLLVDDNEEAEIVSVNQQPTTTISRGGTGQGDIITGGEYVEAGTKLKVEPQISGGGYLRLKYEAELSSFTGAGQNGSAPPRDQSNIHSAVTIPTDYTVVVGGFKLDSSGKTVIKVPLLGDIPLVGLLFQDRNTNDRKTTLFVFLTPRILRDENFSDLKLLTQGPQAEAGLPGDIPPLRPAIIEGSARSPVPGPKVMSAPPPADADAPPPAGRLNP